MERERVIYALHDGQGNYGYIGSTGVNTKTRWWEHRSRARSGHAAPVYQWIRSIGIENLKIETVCAIPDGTDPAILEAHHIKKFLDAGHPIQNQISRDGVPNSNGERMKQILSSQRKGKPTWIKGKRGIEAGWTEERKKAQSERFRQLQVTKS